MPPRSSPVYHMTMTDPANGRPANVVFTDSSASPTIGPDGDVYFGVQEHLPPCARRPGLAAALQRHADQDEDPGSFGWDNTVSVMPARDIPGYHG